MWLLAQSCALSKPALTLPAAVQAKRASLYVYNRETGVVGVVVGEEWSVVVLTAAAATVASCSSCRTTASCIVRPGWLQLQMRGTLV